MKPHKLLTLFLLMGVCYMATEVVYNAFTPFSFALVGTSSIWMGAVGGALGVLLGELSPGGSILPPSSLYALRVLVGGTAINLIELVAGLILNKALNLGIWDYSVYPLNIAGQVCAHHAVIWYLFTPFVFWLDDVMRFYLYQGCRPLPLRRYYSMVLSRVRY